MGLILLTIVPDDKRPWIALLVGMAAISFVLFKPRRRFGGAAKSHDPLEKPSNFGSLAQQRSVERQMQNLLVELSEMARQITGQLDTRAAKLETLIKDADERLAALRRASAAAPASASDQRAPDFRVGAQQSFTFASPSQSIASSENVPTPPVTGPRLTLTYSQADDGPDPRHAEIYRLADQGRGPKEIAATLGRPSGEIELILALRPRRAS
jgi:hypothetical protein